MKRVLFWLTLYAIAMAFLEAAVVVYLRELYYPENILQIFPPKMFTPLDFVVELGREASTLIMMLSVAFLAIPGNATRIFAAFVYQFGVWDVFYYIWLKVTIGWPVRWGEWDILFLIPWAWFGPWLTPVVIALLFAIWGLLVLNDSKESCLSGKFLIAFIGGAVLALVAFLQPAFPYLISGDLQAFLQFQPGGFWWGFYLPGVALMAYGLLGSWLSGRKA
ncbi:MAG: hypothetical protein GXO78_07370 [Calditrichaeota bacterium]|nr:hypothetical protein [Calditrichota bacterium]